MHLQTKTLDCCGNDANNPYSSLPLQNKSNLLKTTGDGEIDQMIRDCLETLDTKGKEYTVGSADRLANFRGVAQDCGITMAQAWNVFFNKHYRSVLSFIKNGRTFSEEGIQGRIKDCIVYLLLFSKMAAEMERMNAPKKEAP